MQRPRRVLAYCRVSSILQARGTSLADQQTAIAAYAKARGLELHRVYVEAESGIHEKLERREQMRALQADVQSGDLVLCDKLDRWSRDPEFTYSSIRRILEAGASFYAVGDQCDPSTRDGDTMLGVRVMIAREEHKRIKERTVGTRRLLRDRGYWAEGPPPYGYRRPVGLRRGLERNVLELVDAEAAKVRQAFEFCAAGHPLSTISGAIGLAKDHVQKALRNRAYLGQIRNTSGEWIPGMHPAIITPDLFVAAGAALDARRLGGARPRAGGGFRTDPWILRDVAVCGRCGARMGASYGARHDYYRCSHRCGARLVRVDMIESAFVPLLVVRMEELRDVLARGPSPALASTIDYAGQRAKLQERRSRFLEAFADGHLDREDLRERMVRIDADLLRISAAEAATERPSRLQDASVRRDALREVETLKRAWRGASAKDRRELVGIFTERVGIVCGEAPVVRWCTAQALVGGL